MDTENGKVNYRYDIMTEVDSIGTAVTRNSGIQTIHTDFRNGTFFLEDYSRGGGIFTGNMNQGTTNSSITDFTDLDNYWNNVNPQMDEIATDVHWGAEMVFDYFRNIHFRQSWDNNNSMVVALVHFSSGFANAFWDGNNMILGMEMEHMIRLYP